MPASRSSRAPSSSSSPSSSPSPSPPSPSPPSTNPPRLAPLNTTISVAASANDLTPVSPAEPRSALAANSAASSSVTAGPSALDDIEMDTIHSHRRRKSSLMTPSGNTGLPPSRPRSASLRSHRRHLSTGGPTLTLGDEPKISEEDGSTGNSSGLVSPVTPRDDFDNDSFSDGDLQDDEETGLTAKEKKRRQKRRTRSTQLDQRFAKGPDMSPEEKQEADRAIVKRIAFNIILILLWYLFSLSISLYNKWMFDKKSLNFAFPLFTTSAHMVVQFALSALVLYSIPSLRPQAAHSSDGGRSRHETEPNTTPVMSKLFYLTRIGPCGAATGLDIGLGNTSLKFISLTFYTMCKSSSLAFVLLFAFILRLEPPTWRLVGIIGTMTLGVVLMVSGEVEFKLGGFSLVISAAFFSGLRWGLTQILLLRHPATSNPFSSIFLLTPVMFFTLVALAIPVEGFGALIEGLKVLAEEWGYFMTPMFLMFPGCIAFLMTAAEFALLQRTSVVTLSIAGIFKEVLTISAASLVFHDQLTLINMIGLITTLIAICAYNYIKISKMRSEAHGKAAEEYDGYHSPSSSSNSDAEDSSAEETVGLLGRTEIDMTGPLVTSDGDIQTNLLSVPQPAESNPISPGRNQ